MKNYGSYLNPVYLHNLLIEERLHVSPNLLQLLLPKVLVRQNLFINPFLINILKNYLLDYVPRQAHSEQSVAVDRD